MEQVRTFRSPIPVSSSTRRPQTRKTTPSTGASSSSSSTMSSARCRRRAELIVEEEELDAPVEGVVFLVCGLRVELETGIGERKVLTCSMSLDVDEQPGLLRNFH